MPNCWFVLTSSDVDRWYARLYPLLADNDVLLICEVKPGDISGWIAKWVIDWIAGAKERILKSHEAT